MPRLDPCRRALLARLYGWRTRTENELARLLLRYRFGRLPTPPEAAKRIDELIATRQAIIEEIAALKDSWSSGGADARAR